MPILASFICLLLISSASCAYNEKEAILQAKYSVITHCSNEQIEKWNCTLCKSTPHLSEVTVVESTATKIKGFVGYDASTQAIVVAWRGTDNNLNWIENMDFKLIDYIGPYRCVNCKIHQGFYNAYYSVSGKTHDAVKQLADKYPKAKIVITGHSLGGALAFIGSTRWNIQLFSSTGSIPGGSTHSTSTGVPGWETVTWPHTCISWSLKFTA
jgi:predicted lipase